MPATLNNMPSIKSDRSEFKIEVLDTLPALNAVVSEWQEFLEEGVTGSNFFNDPAHVIAQLELEPQTQPWVVVLRRGGKICCVAPFYLHGTHLKLELSVVALVSLPVRMLKLFGGQFVVAANVDSANCFHKVFEYLESHKSQFGLILIENVPASTALWGYLQSTSLGEARFRMFLASSQIDTDHQIQFPPNHAEFLSSLSYDTRRRLRRVTRRLQEKGQLRLERITEPGDVPTFLDGLDQIYRDTWQATAVGYTPRNTAAQIRYVSQISCAGYLRGYLLTIDGHPIAFALGYQYKDTYYFLETGFVRAWADSSPGTALIHLFVEDLFRHNSPALLDFILGDQDYKRSLSNSQHRTGSVYVVPSNRWRTVLWIQSLLHACSRWLIRALSTLNVDGWLRERLRRAARRG